MKKTFLLLMAFFTLPMCLLQPRANSATDPARGLA